MADEVTVAKAADALDLRVYAECDMDTLIHGAQASDLLSYVMAEGSQGQFWITVQTHPNIIAVAALAGMSGIAIAGGFEPEADTIARAEDEGITLLGSPETAYVLSGKLYELGVR